MFFHLPVSIILRVGVVTLCVLLCVGVIGAGIDLTNILLLRTLLSENVPL